MNRAVWICAGLLLGVIAIYWPVWDFEFVNYDDSSLVFENAVVTGGFNIDNILAAFSLDLIDWVPLTFITFMIEYEFFGSDAGGYHVVNALFHAANTVLVFFVLRRMTGADWCSAIAAALFAFHPLRVESVAWVSERKDVLSSFFTLLAILAYIRYTQKRSVMRYMVVVVFFALSLMSKMIMVTFPFALLLLDYWPLRNQGKTADGQDRSVSIRMLILEKVPLLAMSIGGMLILVEVFLRQTGMSEKLGEPFGSGIANSVVSWVWYVRCLVWPRGLAVGYPDPVDGWPSKDVLLCAALLLAITVIAVVRVRRWPFLAVGWFWYLGTLVPVVGIGVHIIRADRYTYIPQLGLAVAIVWLTAHLVKHVRVLRHVAIVMTPVILIVLVVLSAQQVRTWRNSEALWKHAAKVSDRNVVACQNVGAILSKKRDHYGAIFYYRRGLMWSPQNHELHTNLANVLQAVDDIDEAILHYEQAISIKPDYLDALNNLGSVLLAKGATARAIGLYERALALDTENALYETNLGLALLSNGEPEKAILRLRATLNRDDRNPNAHLFLGRALAATGLNDQAIAHHHRAIKLQANWPQAHNSLGTLLAKTGKVDEAIAQFEKALAINPQFADARVNLAKARAMKENSRGRGRGQGRDGKKDGD